MRKYPIFTAIFCSILFFHLSASVGRAQTSTTESQAGTKINFTEPLFGVGLYGSATSGAGLSFRAHLANIPLSFQITGIAWKTGKTSFYDLGGEVQYDLSVTTTSRIYAVAGLGSYYYSQSDSNELDGPTRFGLGVGYETPLSNAMSVSAAIMVTVFGPKTSVLPLPSAGFHFYFK